MNSNLLIWVCWSGVIALTGCFPHEAGPRLQHFKNEAPNIGEQAPLFSLIDIKGNWTSLETLIGEKPIVLQLGSHTCPVYRYRQRAMDHLFREFQGRAHFVIVYTLEAHPIGSKSPYSDEEWVTLINRLTNVTIPQPTTGNARKALAVQSKEDLGIHQMMLVDSMDDAIWRRYGSAPSPGFVIDQNGLIVLRQVWINPDEIRKMLQKLLADAQPATVQSR